MQPFKERLENRMSETSEETVEEVSIPVENKDTKKNVLYKNAIKKWGKDSQINMAIEGLSELITVLVRSTRKNRVVTPSEIATEIADVEIMIGQMKVLFRCQSLVDAKKAQQYLKLKKYLMEK